MAARTRKIRHDEETRAKIQTSQLINRLTGHALGAVEMENSQVRAAEVLLDRSLPKLATTSVEVSGPDGGPIETRDISDPAVLTDVGRRLAFLLTSAARAST